MAEIWSLDASLELQIGLEKTNDLRHTLTGSGFSMCNEHKTAQRIMGGRYDGPLRRTM